MSGPPSSMGGYPNPGSNSGPNSQQQPQNLMMYQQSSVGRGLTGMAPGMQQMQNYGPPSQMLPNSMHYRQSPVMGQPAPQSNAVLSGLNPQQPRSPMLSMGGPRSVPTASAGLGMSRGPHSVQSLHHGGPMSVGAQGPQSVGSQSQGVAHSVQSVGGPQSVGAPPSMGPSSVPPGSLPEGAPSNPPSQYAGGPQSVNPGSQLVGGPQSVNPSTPLNPSSQLNVSHTTPGSVIAPGSQQMTSQHTPGSQASQSTAAPASSPAPSIDSGPSDPLSVARNLTLKDLRISLTEFNKAAAMSLRNRGEIDVDNMYESSLNDFLAICDKVDMSLTTVVEAQRLMTRLEKCVAEKSHEGPVPWTSLDAFSKTANELAGVFDNAITSVTKLTSDLRRKEANIQKMDTQ